MDNNNFRRSEPPLYLHMDRPISEKSAHEHRKKTTASEAASVKTAADVAAKTAADVAAKTAAETAAADASEEDTTTSPLQNAHMQMELFCGKIKALMEATYDMNQIRDKYSTLNLSNLDEIMDQELYNLLLCHQANIDSLIRSIEVLAEQ
jgi:hypothetical protein